MLVHTTRAHRAMRGHAPGASTAPPADAAIRSRPAAASRSPPPPRRVRWRSSRSDGDPPPFDPAVLRGQHPVIRLGVGTPRSLTQPGRRACPTLPALQCRRHQHRQRETPAEHPTDRRPPDAPRVCSVSPGHIAVILSRRAPYGVRDTLSSAPPGSARARPLVLRRIVWSRLRPRPGHQGLRKSVSRTLLLSSMDSATSRPSNIRLMSRLVRTCRWAGVAGYVRCRSESASSIMNRV